MLPVKGISNFDLIFVRAFDAGEATDVERLVDNPMPVMFATGDDIVVALLPGWCTVSFVFESEFILKKF